MRKRTQQRPRRRALVLLTVLMVCGCASVEPHLNSAVSWDGVGLSDHQDALQCLGPMSHPTVSCSVGNRETNSNCVLQSWLTDTAQLRLLAERTPAGWVGDVEVLPGHLHVAHLSWDKVGSYHVEYVDGRQVECSVTQDRAGNWTAVRRSL